VAQRWKSFAREASRTVVFLASFGLIAYFGIKAAIKIEATQTRLFLVGIVFAVAFGAAALLDHLLRDQVPTDTQPNGETESWPRWHSQFTGPMVYRQSDRAPYSYVVLPRPVSAWQATAGRFSPPWKPWERSKGDKLAGTTRTRHCSCPWE
jgi:hypothetical protein